MKQVIALFVGLLLFVSLARAETPQRVEIEVTGMTCPFCVYGTEKKLNGLPGVASAEVSLKNKKALIRMEPGQQADLNAIREAITDAGFTPGKVTVESDQVAP
ncbi:MAG TPA: heavy-metal-associated domain-containing protein [Gammaproteobacteria bacterium]|nr:heavy-metal-associated domain-containing protein [Gammaproteobacteria bacterium]